ncbi:MAG: SGNH/GDSL hydrolase family protein [Paludibacter sp.]
MKILFIVRSITLLAFINVYFVGSFTASAQTPSYDANQYMLPYWLSDTMYNESVLMVSTDGVVPAEASLLFLPVKILSVKNSTLTKEYVENVDWVYDNGKLKLLAGSSAAFLTNSQLYPSVSSTTTKPKKGGGFVLFSEGHYFHDLQLAVTYTHQPNVWNGPIPVYSPSNLPLTLQKLNSDAPLKIVFIGNSITEGFNSSGFVGAAPYMPRYSDLVINKLKSTYSSTITAKNVAVRGKDALWGLNNVATLVTPENPDLTVISFGMNDGTAGVLPSVFKTRIQGIMDAVKALNPNAEFILVSPTVANPESNFVGQQVNYNAVLQELKKEGIAVVNMTGVHQELLKHKMFRDMTGNNINHPNDFLQRWYAQQISGLLIDGFVTTGLQALTQTDIKVYPNPCNDELTFSTAAVGQKYKIANLLGQTVCDGFITSSAHKLDLTTLENGTYLLAIQSINGLTVKTIIKN